MSFPRYPKYKDSGVEWLGEVPEDWRVSPLKHAVDPKRPITYGIVQAGSHVLDGVPYIRPVDMSDEEGIVDPASIPRTSDEIATAYARSMIVEGDLVCSIGPSFGKVMVVPAWLSGGNLTQGTSRLAVSGRYEPGFVFWTLRSANSIAQWDAAVGGATFRALNLGPLSETQIAQPPIPEQRCIATFLDQETAKIDALIEEQRRLIELLKEKRQAVISHAVTKGLNPAARMRNSEVPSIGFIPEHWELRRVSSLSKKITNGFVGPTRDIYVETGAPYLQSLHIKKNRIVADNAYFVSEEWSAAHSKSILERGDVLIVQTGDIGQSAVVKDEHVGSNCHALIIVTPRQEVVSGEWLSVLMSSDYGYQTLLSIQTGALHPHLNCGDVKDVLCPVPPREEQDRIVEVLDARRTAHDALVSDAEFCIDLLAERRLALISAAVTGKIDVRDYVIHASPASEEVYESA